VREREKEKERERERETRVLRADGNSEKAWVIMGGAVGDVTQCSVVGVVKQIQWARVYGPFS